MDFRIMSRLRIGYVPLSPTFTSPGDRRRLIFWANSRGHTVVTDIRKQIDVLVVSERADFNSAIISGVKVPVVFDLIDAYLSPINEFEDVLRGLAKKFSGQFSGDLKPFSRIISDFCKRSDAVVCSSEEQEKVIRRFNKNTHVILDFHEEIPFLPLDPKRLQDLNIASILWEGQSSTIKGISSISSALSGISREMDLKINFVTDENYYLFLNKYIERSTLKLLRRELNLVRKGISLAPWSVANLVKNAELSRLAIIPTDLSVPMQRLKPENRLLIMWRLGLPCLTSSSPAYMRVAEEVGVVVACANEYEWFENLHRLLLDPKFGKNQVEKGQNYIRKNHNPTLLLKKWDSAIESVMS